MAIISLVLGIILLLLVPMAWTTNRLSLTL